MDIGRLTAEQTEALALELLSNVTDEAFYRVVRSAAEQLGIDLEDLTAEGGK